MCSDCAEHESSESSHTETFSLLKYKNRDTCPRFLCALPRGFTFCVKMDFIDRLNRLIELYQAVFEFHCCSQLSMEELEEAMP